MKTVATPGDHLEDAPSDPHLTDAPAIVHAVRAGHARRRAPQRGIPPVEIGIEHPADYQRYLCDRFGDIISQPSFDYLSKTPGSWLVVGDHRREVAGGIQLVIERHGIGVGMLVLHLQQIRAGHILTEVADGAGTRDLAVPTDALRGAGGEWVLSVPLRRFRADYDRLAAMSIAKPRALWDPDRIVTHEHDAFPCAYCSAAEINPAEVVVDLDGSRHGLSRNYSLGFTFAPFGNPLSTVHFLAWDRADNPLNMNRVPMTVSDLVKLTQAVNRSIRVFFAQARIGDAPVIDGLSNGWAGCSVYHQHFQFFVPEQRLPVLDASEDGALIRRDDVSVQRLRWPCPVYRIRAGEAITAGLVGNDMAGIWRLLGGSRRFPYKEFGPHHVPAFRELVPTHTQNLHVPGDTEGALAHIFLRDRTRVDYLPATGEMIDPEAGLLALPKKNLGVLEASGAIIMDDGATFDTMRCWSPAQVSLQVRAMIARLAPETARVAEFDAAVSELFPP